MIVTAQQRRELKESGFVLLRGRSVIHVAPEQISHVLPLNSCWFNLVVVYSTDQALEVSEIDVAPVSWTCF